jgi:hypothetical protein
MLIHLRYHQNTNRDKHLYTLPYSSLTGGFGDEQTLNDAQITALSFEPMLLTPYFQLFLGAASCPLEIYKISYLHSI